MNARVRHGEKGSTLIMALVMLSVVGVVIGAALNYAATSNRVSNTSLLPNRASLYAADSATQAAIEYIRDNPDVASDLGFGCVVDAFTYPDPGVGNVSVDVCAQPDSFIYDGNFRAVLLTLAGPGSGEGITFDKNNVFTVSGHVWSNSFVALGSSAEMIVQDGRVWSWNPNSCSGTITAPAGKDCSARTTFGNIVPKVGLDPADPSLGNQDDWQPAGPPGPVQTVPPCTAGAAILQPGVYLHGDHLSGLACNVTLSPGVYYLNFPADGTGASLSSNDDTWRVGRNVTAPCDGTGQGAQIVFANHAKLAMEGNNQTLTLCGRRATADGPLIAMTALRTGTGGGPATNTTLRPTTTATQGGHDLFEAATLVNVVPSGAGYPQDGSHATATVSRNNRTALLNIGSIAPPAGETIPANASVSSAVIRVGHDETTNWSFSTNGANQPKLQWGSCSVPLNPAPTKSATATTYTSANLAPALTACSSFDPSQPATVVWGLTTTNASAATARVDGAQIEVTWSGPGIAAQSGCVTQLLNAGGCYLWTGPSNGHDSMVVDGVVYLPNNALQGTFKNGGIFRIRDALIARSVDLDVNPAAVGSPVIGNALNQLTNGDALFTAQIGSDVWIRSRVDYPDGGADTPSISSWVIER